MSVISRDFGNGVAKIILKGVISKLLVNTRAENPEESITVRRQEKEYGNRYQIRSGDHSENVVFKAN